MSRMGKYLGIMRLMFIEDYRMQAAMIGRFQFLFFPVFIALFAFVIGISSVVILGNVSMDRIYLLLHITMLVYGLAVGGFALFGQQIAEERFGGITVLLSTPNRQPVGFRGLFLVFYIKDVIFYMLFSIIPIIAGVALSIPFSGFRVTSVLFLFLTITMSFMLGISFSFFLSSVYVRWKAVFGLILSCLATAVLGALLGFYEIEFLMPALTFQLTGSPIHIGMTLLLIVFFSFFAVMFLKIEFGRDSERYLPEIIPTKEKFGFAHSHSTYMAKEWLDLRRSGHMAPVLGVYVLPLIFLAVTLWFLRSVIALPIHFNVVFYAGMMGLFSVTIYSWLTLGDSEFYQVLPVTVPKLIKVKLRLFGLFTYSISTVFLVVLSILNLELHLLWLAIMVAFVTSTYVVIATAYLTGLRTNTYLFDATVLARFSGMVLPPLIAIIIASLALTDNFLLSTVFIMLICGILILGILLLYRKIDERWEKEGFVM